MVCIYCGSATKVTNSRPQRRLHQVWRRRTCTKCGAIFTTLEAADFTSSLVVRDKDTLKPFRRDQLFVSILQAVGHRKDPLSDASAITATITARLLQSTEGASIKSTDIIKNSLEVLQRFDKAAAVQYAAYHKT